MLFKLSNLNSKLALTLGYLNPALYNSVLGIKFGTSCTELVMLLLGNVAFKILLSYLCLHMNTHVYNVYKDKFCCEYQMERNISVWPTDRNDQTSQRGPSSKLVPNILVGPNRNGLFHLMYQLKLPEFWVEWKAPQLFMKIQDNFYWV